MSKLASLTLENFRGHELLAVQLAPVTVFTGGNGTGKSSVRDALEWLFSGRCPQTNERGQGPIVRTGASNCSVSAELPGGGVITRTSGGGLRCSWAPGHKKPELPLAQAIGCDGQQARLAIQAGRFLELKAADRKELLFDVLDLHTTAEFMQEQIRSVHGEEVLATANQIIGFANLGNLEAAYDRCDKARTLANRNIKELTAHIKVAAQEQADMDLIYVPEEELQQLLEQEKALLKEERQLHWDSRLWSADHIEEQKGKLLETRNQLNCSACGQRIQDTAERQDALATLMAEIAELEEKAPAKRLEIDAKRAEILEKVARIREKTSCGSKYRESASNLSNSRSRLKSATEQAEKLKILLEVYGSGPSSVLHQRIKPRIGDWEARINAVSGRWGMICRYTPALTLEVAKDGDWVPYEALSDAERLLSSLAHQVALAQKLGLRIVCLDRIEALDAGNQATLIEKALELTSAGELDHVLLMGVYLSKSAAGMNAEFLWHNLQRYIGKATAAA